MSLLTVILIAWAAIVAAEAYRRTGPTAPRGVVVLVITIVLLVLWLFFEVLRVGVTRIG
jgi:hypothetical protein